MARYGAASAAVEASQEDARRLRWEWVACDTELVVKLAEGFSRRLRKELSRATLAEVNRRNRSNPPGVCASHDFCDANEPMGAAAESLGVDPMTDKGSAVWSRAWDIAKACNFQL